MTGSSSSHAVTNNHAGIRRGAWSKEEDVRLRRCVEKYGQGHWHLVPSRAGLNRCGKSCRLRWLNYLTPNINRGPFGEDEDDVIIRMQRVLGNRWSLIAGRMHGRTANDIKNRWNSYLQKKMVAHQPPKKAPAVPFVVVAKPQAHRPAVKPPPWFKIQQVQRAEESAGIFTEQFCFPSWFESTSIQGRGEEAGRRELGESHQAREESLLSEILLDLDGKDSHLQATTAPIEYELESAPEISFDLDGKESSLQGTTALTGSELEWVPEILSDFDGMEAPLQTTATLTEPELESLPEILFDLDSKEFPPQATTALTRAELEWENLLSDTEFWSSLDINGGTIFQPGGAQAPPPNLPKS